MFPHSSHRTMHRFTYLLIAGFLWEIRFHKLCGNIKSQNNNNFSNFAPKNEIIEKEKFKLNPNIFPLEVILANHFILQQVVRWVGEVVRDRARPNFPPPTWSGSRPSEFETAFPLRTPPWKLLQDSFFWPIEVARTQPPGSSSHIFFASQLDSASSQHKGAYIISKPSVIAILGS